MLPVMMIVVLWAQGALQPLRADYVGDHGAFATVEECQKSVAAAIQQGNTMIEQHAIKGVTVVDAFCLDVTKLPAVTQAPAQAE